MSVSRWRGVDLRDGKNELIAIVRDAEGNEAAATDAHRSLLRRRGARRDRARSLDARRRRPHAADDRGAHDRCVGQAGASRHARRVQRRGAVSLVVGSRIARRQQAGRRRRRASRRSASTPTASRASSWSRRRRPARRSCGCASASVAQQEIRVWLEPQARDWILVGLAEEHGRVQHDQRQHAVGRRCRPGRGLRDDGRVAFFAKGAIKGEYLLTAAYDSARDHEVEKDRLLGVGRAGSLLHAVRRCDRAALRGGDDAQAVREAGAPPVRRAVRRLRDRPDRDRAVALQPYVHGLQVRLRRRALRLQRVRRRVRAGLREGRAAGRRHLGPVSPVAPAADRQQRQDPPRSARPLPQRGRGRVAAADARSSTTASTISTARCSSSSRCRAATRTSTRCTSSPSTKC